jgi:hypothetical protein
MNNISKDEASMLTKYEQEIARLRRKEDQAWECAGCARTDGDKADEQRWFTKAREYAAQRKACIENWNAWHK